jgi:DNA-binding beta-propeller fold protein YncE
MNIRSLALAFTTVALASCAGPQTSQPCADGDTIVHACDECHVQTALCVEGSFGAFGACEPLPGCGATTSSSSGGGATTSSSASTSTGGGGGATTSSTSSGGGTCNDGDVYTQSCGNCGTQKKTCSSGTWSAFSPCAGEGVCAAGATDSQACGTDVGTCHAGTQARTCDASCQWSAWSACGNGYVGPVPEICGNGLDDDCNGADDDWCDCPPVAVGAGSSFPLTGQIKKLVADPKRCFVYALDGGSPSRVVILDVKAKSILTSVTLPFAANDLDIAPSGGTLAVSHDAAHKISTVDLASWTVASTISTLSDPYALEVSDTGRAYYVELDQWTSVHGLDLSMGSSSDTNLGSWALYEGDAELSADGAFLYLGESGISGGSLSKYNVSGNGFTKVDESTWDDGYGFPYPARSVYLSPGGNHVYYAGHQLDANELSVVRGKTGELVFTESPTETFAIGETKVFDAELVKPVATLAHPAAAAALTGAGKELWYYSAQTGRVYYQNTGDLLAGVTLGMRERAPLALSKYTFAKLVHDPVRPRLYGLDAARESVVSIDTATHQPLKEIFVGSVPTDLSVDAAGAHLWVGHWETLALARIDLGAFTFDGFVPTPRIPYDVQALSNGKVAVIDEDQWTTPTLIDGMTGAVLASSSWGAYEGALTATADGNQLFVGESSLSGSNITKYDVSGSMLVQLSKSTYDMNYGFPYPSRDAVAVPDGSGVFYAHYLLDGANLSILKYPISDTILSVTPNSKLAISKTTIYRVQDGTVAAQLPSPAPVHAVSPDGATLYVAAGGTISTVDLSAY